MATQLENIINLAASLVIQGKATENNAIEMALKIDSEKCLNAIEDLQDMNRGYVNQENKTQKAFGILLNSVYQGLNN